MLCVSISGAAITVNNSPTKDKKLNLNFATESPEVNTRLLEDIKSNVQKYMNFEEYNDFSKPRDKIKDIDFPWSDKPVQSGAGDFVEWIINVNYKNKYFQEEITISPLDFIKRFLNNPWYFETCYFDVDEDGTDDLIVRYSIFFSRLVNYQEGIDERSIRTCLRVDTSGILDRTAKLEVWSELSFNIGLIQLGKSKDIVEKYNSKIKLPVIVLLEKIKSSFEKLKFTKLENFVNKLLDKVNPVVEKNENEPPLGVQTSSNDWISMGIGIGSKEGEKIPIYFEKRLNVAKKRILSPTIYEHEICQLTTKEPLSLIFGFKSFKGGSNSPIIDAAFSVEFDPAIYLRTQYIPLKRYIYYNYDTGSYNNAETNVTFTGRLKEGIEESVELTLIFDDTKDIAHSNNWMSFDVDILGFEYKANKKFDIGLLVTSPIFSAKAKFVGIPSSIEYFFDTDLEITYQQGQLFDVKATGSLNLQMNSKLDDIILYYPKIGSQAPDIEFIKISGVPSINSFTAYSHLKIKNESMVTLLGEGYVDLSMSSDLSSINVFYFKADPEDPDKMFIDVPSGIPSSQRVGGVLRLYIDIDNFSNQNNYVFGRAYRTSSGGINEIGVYLPGNISPDPILKFTEIPSNADIEGKLIWNKLQGYGTASRSDSSGSDPIEFNLDIGTFNIYNKLTIGNGMIYIGAHLEESGYFSFDTQNEMLGEEFSISDTSTGNQFGINVAKVLANDLQVEWNADFSQQPIEIDELAIEGDVSLFEDFEVSGTIQGKNLGFEGDWKIGEEGKFSVDFYQDEPIELIFDDFLKNNTQFDVSGGVVISEDFHFDIKWNWEQGTSYSDPGYFLINEDTNDPNFDWIFLNITYIPDGYQTPQYGIEVGATDILVIVYLKWWKGNSVIIPDVWWYMVIQGNFYLHLLWKGNWNMNVQDWF